MIRHKTALILCAVYLFSAGLVRAERKIIIGNQYDFSFGGTNQSSFTSSRLQSGLAPFFGFYPSVSMQAIGRTSQLNMSYTALAERFNGDRNLNTLAHVATADFIIRPARRWTLGFDGSFFSAPDYTTTDVLSGTAPSPERFRFAFQPALADSTLRTLRGGVKGTIDLNYRSYLTYDASVMSLNYDQSSKATPLLDQTRKEARFGYWYRLTAHQSLDLQYIYIGNSYDNFGQGRAQGVVAGYNRQFSPALRMRFEAGPAHVRFDDANSYGYFASATLMRTIRSSQISVSYAHSPGDSSGLGSLSNLHHAGVAVFSPLWKKIAISASAAAFSSRGIVDSTSDYRGFYGTLDLSYPLTRRWFMTWGGSYRINRYGNPLDQEFKRLYISLRFRAPDLWRTSL